VFSGEFNSPLLIKTKYNMKGTFPVNKFRELETPFYYYDVNVLRETLSCINKEAGKYNNFCVHYAVKANANHKVLTIIRESGLGADCVSGGEIRAAIKAGFPTNKIVYAGVGKTDWEINLGLDYDIFCFNVESVPELEIINELASAKGKTARVAFRINPNVGAHTHANITTGLAENKFGISMEDMDKVIDMAGTLPHVKFVGLHFHIGSQILDMGDFVALCNRVNELQEKLYARQIIVEHINVGGGLGIDYAHPNRQAIPNFTEYFATYHKHLKLRPQQTLHFELGRAVVGQCGSLISKVIYVKQGTNKQFAILDAGMTDLIRPALYQAYHKIENITSEEPMETYDVVGPICESSDVFGKAIDLNKAHRGDLFALRSAGAYGEIMASAYNCRVLPKGYTSEELV
jgi:diaminopimelate decarboxylase